MTKPFTLTSMTNNLLPRFVLEDNPRLRVFVESFFEFIESTHIRRGKILHRPQDLLSNLILDHDIDQTGRLTVPKDQVTDTDIEYTVTKFYSFFKQTYMVNYPYIGKFQKTTNSFVDDIIDEGDIDQDISTEFVSLLKRIKEFYRTKGSVISFKYFFQSVFNSEISIYYPNEDILILSDGTWFEPFYIQIGKYPKNQLTENTLPTEVELLTPDEVDSLIGHTINFLNPDVPEDLAFNGFFSERHIFKNRVTAKDEFHVWVLLTSRVGFIKEGFILDLDELDIDIELAADQELRIVAKNLPSKATKYRGTYDPAETYNEGELVYDTNTILDTTPEYYMQNLGSWEVLPATADPELIGIEDSFEGRWITDDGFLSSSKKLQDNDYYQIFSYDVQSRLPLNQWQSTLKKNVHPSGFKMFNTLLAYDPIVIDNIFSFVTNNSSHLTFYSSFDAVPQFNGRKEQETKYSNKQQVFVVSNDTSNVANEQKRFTKIRDYADTSIDFFFRTGNHSNSFYFGGPAQSDHIYLTEGSVRMTDSQYLSFGLNKQDESRFFNKSSYYLRAIDDWANNSYNDIQIRRFDLNKDIQTIRKRVLNEHIISGDYQFEISTDFLDQIFKDHTDYSNFIDPNGAITTISSTFNSSNSMVFREGQYISLDAGTITATKTINNEVTVTCNISPTVAVPELHDLLEVHLFTSKTAPLVFEHLVTNGYEVELDALYMNSDILVFEELSGSTYWSLKPPHAYNINQTKLLLNNVDINNNSKIRVFVFPRIMQNSSERQFTKELSFSSADFTSYLNENTNTIQTNQIVVPFEYRSSYMNQYR